MPLPEKLSVTLSFECITFKIPNVLNIDEGIKHKKLALRKTD